MIIVINSGTTQDHQDLKSINRPFPIIIGISFSSSQDELNSHKSEKQSIFGGNTAAAKGELVSSHSTFTDRSFLEIKIHTQKIWMGERVI